MQDTTKYPQFIPDKPIGEDCFEGHSQIKLAQGLCEYVRKVDEKPDNIGTQDSMTGHTMPRIIGLEGGWGSGKSNVVNMLGSELSKDGYYIFTYDAWGHQEDLQRRSILETLAGNLIKNKVLQGSVEIQMRNGKFNKDIWQNQLSMLLSNKTTTIRKSSPKLTSSALWGIIIVAFFAFCSLIADQLISNKNDFRCLWWIDFLPLFLAAILAWFYNCKDGSFDNIFRMIDHTNNDTIDEEFTSSDEPSVAEFKNWMYAVSQYLGNNKKNQYKKLIIVFDNMDRLPCDKVMQLWSSIYTFFAGGEFENIWAVIPYDYEHLCQAIIGIDNQGSASDKDKERIKQFISKTFPITYHVPKPVITDYKRLFSTYFDKAFGPDEHDKEHICQVFMHLEKNPNPRTVIRFVNELVGMRLQWHDDKYRLQNQALYILKKDQIHYSGERQDSQLLSDELFKGVTSFYPDQEKVRTELCQYAYGLEDENLASEIPLRNELKRKVESGESISQYADKPNFLPVFEALIADTDQASLNNVVKSMASLDNVNFSDEVKSRIQFKWDFLANSKAESEYFSHEYDETLTILINHATPVRTINMAKSYARSMQQIKVTNGANYYIAQNKIHQSLQDAQIEYNYDDWYNPIICDPEYFIQYVCKAKDNYTRYGLTANNKALNEYLLNRIIVGDSQVSTVVDYIKDDDEYNLESLRKGLENAINKDIIKKDISVAAYVNRVLAEKNKLLDVRFPNDKIASYLNEDKSLWEEKLPAGLEDVIAMHLAYGNDINELDDAMLPRISSCMDMYMEYTELLKHTGKEGSAFRKLNKYCIENMKGHRLNTLYAAQHLKELHDSLGLDIDVMLQQFNRWPKIDWGEITADNDYVKNVKSYVHQSFFTAYRDNKGSFSNSIIELGIKSLSCQNKGFLVKRQYIGQPYNRTEILQFDDYWKSFIETYLGTSELQKASSIITEEAITILQWIYEKNEVKVPDLIDLILERADESTIKTYLHTMMNEHFVKTDITKNKFLFFGKYLPILGDDMDSNIARGLMQHFIKPICKDEECAAIIINEKKFYFSIMRKDVDIASVIIKEIIDMEVYSQVSEEIKELFPNKE